MSERTAPPGERAVGATTVGAFEAKTHFSELLQRAHRGEVIVITRRGEPYAKLTPVGDPHDVEAALAAVARIEETAKRLARSNVTLDEIKAWIAEGRT
jgi:prevent-host-death family protein